jgi:hypothetical protein
MTSSPTASTTPSTDEPLPLARPGWSALVLLSTAVTVAVVNVLVLVIGRASADGAGLVVRQAGAEPHVIELSGVVFTSTVPLLIGTGLAVLLARWWSPVVLVAQVIGFGLASLSAIGPLASESDDSTRFSLALMHLLVGVGVVVGLQIVRRGAGRQGGRGRADESTSARLAVGDTRG